jgi:plastocyanin
MNHNGYRSNWALLAAIGLMVLLAAGLTATAQAETFAVTIQETYLPSQIFITAGDTVRWINLDQAVHNVHSGTPEAPTALFDSGNIISMSTYEVVFGLPGEYPYYDAYFPANTGLVTVETVVGVETDEAKAEPFVLYQNVPNPFNSQTMFTFDLREQGDVRLAVYSVTGQKVWEQVEHALSPGRHSIKWNATDQSGATLSTGIYLYTLEYEGKTAVRRMMFMK